jgi:hypothetical protein
VWPTPAQPSSAPRPKVEPQSDSADAQVVGVRTATDREAAARAAAVVVDDAIKDDGSADRERNRERFRAAQRRGPNWFDFRTTSMKRPGLPPTEAKRGVQRGTPAPASQRANDSDDENTVHYDAPTTFGSAALRLSLCPASRPRDMDLSEASAAKAGRESWPALGDSRTSSGGDPRGHVGRLNNDAVAVASASASSRQERKMR